MHDLRRDQWLLVRFSSHDLARLTYLMTHV